MRLVTLKLERHADIPRLRQVGLGVARGLNLDAFAQTRIVTALLELGRNAIVHGGGGRVSLAVAPEGDVVILVATVTDDGPGMPNPDGGSGGMAGDGTVGLGLGLRGVERIADRFEIKSDASGTRVTAAFETPHPAGATAELAATLTDAVAQLNPVDPAVALTHQNQELLRAISERDLLLQEVHHRTRNNLSLINSLVRLSSRSAKGEEARELLTDLGVRVEAVLGVHEQLERNESSDRLALQPFLKSIADRIQSAFSTVSARVRIRVGGDDLHAEGRLGVDIGLIVGELVTNALKHAFAGREEGLVEIRLRGDEGAGELELTVRDDGPGLPEGMSRPNRKSSLGWRVVETMAARYDGRIEVTNDNGLRVRVVLEDPSQGSK